MKEYDIRPQEIFAEYLRLSEADAQAIFDHTQAQTRPCPACGGAAEEPAFVKSGFQFVRCPSCRTLFANPLPPASQFERFYRDGQAFRYWADVFLPRVMAARRASIVRPRVDRIAGLCAERGLTPARVLDVGAGHGMFLEEWRARLPATELYAVEPNGIMAALCRKSGFVTLEDIGERAAALWPEITDLLTCFEVLEHVPDPLLFLTSLQTMIRPGGFALVTTLGCDGFDIRLLGERANCICPPGHINFLSVKGFEAVFRRAGFATVEVSTPGELDVDIALNTLKQSKVNLGGFEQFLLGCEPDVLADFQRFLVRNRLSSHTWILAQKAE